MVSKILIGCPDSVDSGDRDRDGIPDHLDECPLSSETYNVFQDQDGCPDNSSGLSALDFDGIELLI